MHCFESGCLVITILNFKFLGQLFIVDTKYTYTKIKVVVHVIINDQWNQTARLYEIQITVIYSRTILVAVTSECPVKKLSAKPGLEHWQTVQTKIRNRKTRRLIRVCTVCLNYRKLRVKWNSLNWVPVLDTWSRTIFPAYTQRQSTHQYSQYFDLTCNYTIKDCKQCRSSWCFGCRCTVFTVSIGLDISEETVKIQIRCLKILRLISVYTVCHATSSFFFFKLLNR